MGGGGGKHFKEKQASLASQKIIVDDGGGDFQASFPDIFAQYQNPALTRDIAVANKAWNSWKTTPFDWWQCQLNFAVWCATAGCSVSVEDHLQATDPLLASLYRFHVYFTTRRILEELRVALSGEKSHSWYLKTFDARAYKRLCSEFGVSLETDWRQKLDHGCQGLGSWSTYMEPSGTYRHAHYSDGLFFHPKDAIRHNRDISGTMTVFILDKSEGFTQAGVERLNDLIRTYVWAILGAQAQTRSNILKAGTGFDAQKQFLANVEDAIASPVDIPSRHRSISKDAPVCLDPSRLRLWDWALPPPERHGPPPGQCPGLQQRNRDCWIRSSYRPQPGNQRVGADRQDHSRCPLKEKSQPQPGLITRGRRVANPQLMLRSNGVMLLMLRSNGVKNNTRRVARPLRATETKRRLS